MAEQLLHDVLGHPVVDHAGAEGVTKAVAGDGDRRAGFVAHIDALLPFPQLGAEGGRVVGLGSVGVVGDAGEQPGCPRRPAPPVMVLLGADGVGGLGAERDELVGADLQVVEAQARPAAAIGDDRVELQRAGVPDPKSRLDHQHDEMSCGGRGQLVEMGVRLELVHDELGHETREPVVAVGELFFVDDGIVWQAGQPAVATAGVEEPAQHRQRQQLGVGRIGARMQPRQVALEHRSGDARLVVDVGVALGEEPREPAHGERPGADRPERAACRKPQPGPHLHLVAQPGLGDGAEAGGAPAAARPDAQPASIPVVAGVLGLDADPVAANQSEVDGIGGCGDLAAHRPAASSLHTPAATSAWRMSSTSRCT
jgi:hypothetical protein